MVEPLKRAAKLLWERKYAIFFIGFPILRVEVSSDAHFFLELDVENEDGDILRKGCCCG